MSENKMTAADELRALNAGKRSDAAAGAGRPYIINPRAPTEVVDILFKKYFRKGSVTTIKYYRGTWYVWDGICYLDTEEEVIRKKIYDFLDLCYDPVKDAPAIPDTKIVNNVLDRMKSEAHLSERLEIPCWIESQRTDSPENYLTCNNGIINLLDGKLQSHTPELFTTSALNFSYDVEAPAPARWLKFLEELWGEDKESIDTLQNILGYFLTYDTSYQKIFLIVGPPRSGKSTIGKMIEDGLIGERNAQSTPSYELENNFGLASLIDKTLAIIPDARFMNNSKQSIATERMLSISGEDSITVDRKFKKSWKGRMKLRFLIFANEVPKIVDASGAVKSRFVILRLVNDFLGKEDLHLSEKLLLELPGILNWAIEGWRQLKERGRFIQPISGEEDLETLMQLGSPVKAFLQDCCEFHSDYEIAMGELFQAWEAWNIEENRDYIGTKATFSRDLRAACPRVRRAQKTGGVRYYYGLRLKTEIISPEDSKDWGSGNLF